MGGQGNRWWRRFLKIRRPVTYCEIEIRSMGMTFASESKAWAWRRSSPRRPAPGSGLTSERLIGSVRRDCLDHVIVLGEGHLRRILKSYLEYYHGSRTHLGLGKDTPEPRAVQPPEMGEIVALPQVGGLHHGYERRAA